MSISGTYRLDVAETEPAPPPTEEPMQMSQDMSFEQRIEQRLAYIEADLGILVNYMRVVAEELGLRARVQPLNDELDRIRDERMDRVTMPAGNGNGGTDAQ